MKKILSTLLVLMFCVTSIIPAYAATPPDTAKAIFTFADATGKIGETVSVHISLKSSEDINTIALSQFVYDDEALTFTGFSDYDAISDLAAITPTFDNANKAIVVGLRSASKYDVAICKMNFTIKKAGTHTVSATALARNNSTDVEAFVVSSTIEVAKKKLTVSGIEVQNRTYDGTTNATISGGTLNGVENGDDVSISGSITGSFASKDSADNIAVNIDTITLQGADKDKYTLTQPTGITANITQVPLTVTARSYQIIKDNALPTLEYYITDGQLFGEDEITGELSTTATGAELGDFDITKGTLTVSENYNLSFVKGTLSVVDKTPQNIVVSDMPASKTYGDEGFTVEVTPDAESGLTDITYTSSETDVAEIDADGVVTIKNAGTTTITVSQAGDATYAPFSKQHVLTVNKKVIDITAEDKSKKVGTVDPELTYIPYPLVLVGEDVVSGSLSRQEGESVGTYDITRGTLDINDNYQINFTKGTFTILDKTSQTITFADIPEKTYGDASFQLEVTKDTTSNLDTFTYASSNTEVATVDTDGNVTIVGAGEADITVNQAGDADYAETSVTKQLVVKKRHLQ